MFDASVLTTAPLCCTSTILLETKLLYKTKNYHGQNRPPDTNSRFVYFVLLKSFVIVFKKPHVSQAIPACSSLVNLWILVFCSPYRFPMGLKSSFCAHQSITFTLVMQLFLYQKRHMFWVVNPDPVLLQILESFFQNCHIAFFLQDSFRLDTLTSL